VRRTARSPAACLPGFRGRPAASYGLALDRAGGCVVVEIDRPAGRERFRPAVPDDPGHGVPAEMHALAFERRRSKASEILTARNRGRHGRTATRGREWKRQALHRR
jgi:hypothetical protein